MYKSFIKTAIKVSLSIIILMALSYLFGIDELYNREDVFKYLYLAVCAIVYSVIHCLVQIAA